MPRDSRLYMTFPIDFHRHPKVRALSDAAFRALVESNGESRIAETDGRLEASEAEWLWAKEVLDELVQSHPSRPLMFRDGDAYVIRSYSEHQFTTADKERLAQISRDNGAKGGRPRNPGKPAQVFSEPSGTQTQPESESESGLETKTTYVSQSSYVPEREHPVDNTSRGVLQSYGLDPDGLRTLIHQHTQRAVTPAGAMRVAMWLLEKGRNVKQPGAYVKRCLTSSPLEVQQFIDEQALT